MLYNTVSSATMRTNYAASCSTLKKTNQYATQSCPKCKTGTIEFFFDQAADDHYGSCLNCGLELYNTPPAI